MFDLSRVSSVSGLLIDMHLYDDAVLTHCVRVCELAMKLGKELELSEDDLLLLRFSALLHDYGKIYLDKDVLFKSGDLSDDEFVHIRSSVVNGTFFLRTLYGVPEEIISVIASHHSGEINVSVIHQILAVADAFDELQKEYCFNEPAKQAMDILIKNLQFSGGIANALKKVVNSTGSCNLR